MAAAGNCNIEDHCVRCDVMILSGQTGEWRKSPST